MAVTLSLAEAVAEYVHDGSTVALEGFTHLIPFAAGHEIIRQGQRDLTLVRMTPDLVYDQMIGMSAASKLVFSWGGNPGVGSLHRFRDAVEHGWPQPLTLDERSHADMINAYAAGAAGLPFGVFRGYSGSDLPKHNANIRSVVCPFTGETLAATPAIRTDTTIIHAQKADRHGNVLLWGIVGVQKEAALCAEHIVVTVEEIVESLDPWPNACVLPGWVVSAVCEVPGGAYPSYALGYYERDNRFYIDWDGIARDREKFSQWMHRHVTGTRDFAGFRRELARSRGPMTAPMPTATLEDLMTVAAARALTDGDVCFVGIGIPSTAANLARLTHAPNLVLIYESGTIGAKPTVLPLSIGDGELALTADTVVPTPELFRYWLQGGRIDVGFLGAAQLDRYGDLNSTVIGEYARPATRLPGAGGAPEIASQARSVLVVIRQSRRTFVERLDFVTSHGRPRKVITDLGVLEPRAEDGELVATELHAGVSRRQMLEATGWPLRFASELREGLPPRAEELAALRELKARTAGAHAGS